MRTTAQVTVALPSWGCAVRTGTAATGDRLRPESSHQRIPRVSADTRGQRAPRQTAQTRTLPTKCHARRCARDFRRKCKGGDGESLGPRGRLCQLPATDGTSLGPSVLMHKVQIIVPALNTLFERQRKTHTHPERERERRFHPRIYSLNTTMPWAKAGVKNPIQVSHMGGRNPST